MVLSKAELIQRLHHEVKILLHLASKADAAMLDYRPTPGQRSLLELLQFLTIFVPIHLRTIHAGVWDMAAWRDSWRTEEATAATRDLDDIKLAIAAQPALIAELVEILSDDDLRADMEMFGSTESRGSWIVWMVLCHYAAYRMQLFLYLKACGCTQLGTLDLWAGVERWPSAAP